MKSNINILYKIEKNNFVVLIDLSDALLRSVSYCFTQLFGIEILQ